MMNNIRGYKLLSNAEIIVSGFVSDYFNDFMKQHILPPGYGYKVTYSRWDVGVFYIFDKTSKQILIVKKNEDE